MGASEIIELDGLTGVQYVVKQFGRALAKAPDDWRDDYLIRSYQEKNPDVDVWAELRRLAEQDADLRRYLDTIAATQARRAAQQPPSREVIDLEQVIRVPRQRALSFRMRRNMQPPQLQWLAERLLIEKSPTVLENLLFFFGYVKFPFDYQPILALAQREPAGRSRIAKFAIDALQHLHAPAIRDFALQRLARTTRPARYTSILRSNYQAGDAALLTATIGRFHDEHTIEMLAVSYLDIYRDNPTPECQAPLVALYQKMTCGIHRTDVVRLLLDNDVLPDWMNEELPFDSSDETRLLHQTHK